MAEYSGEQLDQPDRSLPARLPIARYDPCFRAQLDNHETEDTEITLCGSAPLNRKVLPREALTSGHILTV